MSRRTKYRFCAAKGASDQEKDLAAQQAAFATTLSNNYASQFGKQSAITDSLQSSLQPVINRGASQYGYSNAEDAALRTQASAGTSAAFRSAKQSLGENQAAAGGGDQFLGSGVKAQQQADLATSAAQTEAGQQLGITTAGYDTGRKQYDAAVGADENLAGILNPTAAAGVAAGANGSAFSDASTVTQQNAAASPWGVVGGVIGGAAGAFAGPMGAAVGKQIGSNIGNSASGANVANIGATNGNSYFDEDTD